MICLNKVRATSIKSFIPSPFAFASIYRSLACQAEKENPLPDDNNSSRDLFAFKPSYRNACACLTNTEN